MHIDSAIQAGPLMNMIPPAGVIINKKTGLPVQVSGSITCQPAIHPGTYGLHHVVSAAFFPLDKIRPADSLV
jgi:hypothetical protein